MPDQDVVALVVIIVVGAFVLSAAVCMGFGAFVAAGDPYRDQEFSWEPAPRNQSSNAPGTAGPGGSPIQRGAAWEQ